MAIKFYKYQAVGNDFVVIDNRKYNLSKYDQNKWCLLSNRKMGIGADGVLLLETEPEGNNNNNNIDFKMVYLNSDGKEAEMCGNGARSITHFAHFILALKKELKYTFKTANGIYNSYISEDASEGIIKVEMTNITEQPEIEKLLNSNNDFKSYLKNDFTNAFFLNTGVPHLCLKVKSKKNLDELDLKKIAPFFRYHNIFSPNGTNVNFFTEPNDDGKIFVRTYERGVEDETLSCGTGAVAVALSCKKLFSKWRDHSELRMLSQGGELIVSFNNTSKEKIGNVFLGGAVEKVFEGTYYF
ncbi:MAG: diaminopimelate epimerase [Oligoflexia bacterium]|nr:diaminopimelate epimerase [Oligoflexia bacterium]